MAKKNFSEKHEDILIFLEDNISKLVKLKAVSRAKYKEYDEHFMNYLTAESIDDEYRMEMYHEWVENSYAALRAKLNAAIEADSELTKNSVVKEYIRLIK